VKNRDRQCAVLLASGLTGHEVATKLGLADRTIDSIRAQPDVRALIDRLEEDGITPRQKLEALMCSANDQVALKAAEALARLDPEQVRTESAGAIAHIWYSFCPACREVGSLTETDTDEPPPDFPRQAPGFVPLHLRNETGSL
jgi:hypothetical protein